MPNLARRVRNLIFARKLPHGTVIESMPEMPHRKDFRSLAAIAAEHGLSSVFVLHGSSIKLPGGMLVVTGPQAIGKSTTLRRINKQTVSESAAIGVRKDGAFIISTGLERYAGIRSRVSYHLRRLLDVGSSSLARDNNAVTSRTPTGRRLVNAADYATTVISLMIFAAIPRKQFCSGLMPVRKILCFHSENALKSTAPNKLYGNTLAESTVEALSRALPENVELIKVNTHGKTRREIAEIITSHTKELAGKQQSANR